MKEPLLVDIPVSGLNVVCRLGDVLNCKGLSLGQSFKAPIVVEWEILINSYTEKLEHEVSAKESARPQESLLR